MVVVSGHSMTGVRCPVSAIDAGASGAGDDQQVSAICSRTGGDMGRFFHEGVWSDGQHCFVSTSSIANGAYRGGKSSGFLEAEADGVASPITTRRYVTFSQTAADGERGMICGPQPPVGVRVAIESQGCAGRSNLV
jgi:hypothetical protein